MTPLLELHALSVGYDAPLFEPVDLRLQEGELVGVWGPNGAGKSTLLKAIAGEAPVLGGRIRRRPGLRIGVQQQHPVRLPEMPLTGREFLGLMRAADAPPPGPLRVALDRRIDRLSGGQFQLLAIWASLAGEADVVLLDEPTNNLDPESTADLVDILGRLPAHRAVVLVSHERDFIERTCTRRLELGRWN